MADHADEAGESMEQDIERSLREHRRKAQSAGMPAVGSCYYCASDLKPGLIFCDSDCRDDFERRKTLARR